MKVKSEIFDTHIDDVDFVIADVETTGLKADNGDRVCEIAAVKLRAGAVVESFNKLINPQSPISSGAFMVNKISPQMVADAPTFPEIAEALYHFIKDSVVVAYNTPFDLSFLDNEFRLAGLPTVKNPSLDVLKLARQFLPGLYKYRQEDVAFSLNLDFPVKHRALEDVLITSKIFNVIIKIIKAHGITRLKDILRTDLLQQLTKIRIEIMNEAMLNEASVWIKYFSPHIREISEEIVTPKKINYDGRNNYVEALSLSEKTIRHYSLNKIMDIKIIDK